MSESNSRVNVGELVELLNELRNSTEKEKESAPKESSEKAGGGREEELNKVIEGLKRRIEHQDERILQQNDQINELRRQLSNIGGATVSTNAVISSGASVSAGANANSGVVSVGAGTNAVSVPNTNAVNTTAQVPFSPYSAPTGNGRHPYLNGAR